MLGLVNEVRQKLGPVESFLYSLHRLLSLQLFDEIGTKIASKEFKRNFYELTDRKREIGDATNYGGIL